MIPSRRDMFDLPENVANLNCYNSGCSWTAYLATGSRFF